MRRALICGAGEAGMMVLDEIVRYPEQGISVCGFIDDDRRKIGGSILGVRVLGGRKSLSGWIRRLKIDEVIIAMPSIPKPVIRDIVRTCRSEKVKLLIVPSTMEIIQGTVRFDQIKQLDLADLLERDEVEIDTDGIRRSVEGKRVLVSGAAGSIGGTIVSELFAFSPEEVIALDINENGLFYLSGAAGEQAAADGCRLVPCVADIKDRSMLAELFHRLRPDIVFHAAAYKHVPLMEAHARAAFLNNVIGTRNLLEAASAAGVHRFIGISTDKAVYPVSVMGKTKRICELLIHSYSSKGLGSCSVRFGNVLGSNGSVLTVFREQIRRGGPVTVTSPHMERYFMTMREAARLVLQAAAAGASGDVYVLDMGRPIRIRDLAENLIILSGLTPGVDIQIDYTGVRAGEKYSEELFHRDADVYASDFDGIFIEKSAGGTDFLSERISALEKKIYHIDTEEIIREMDLIVGGSHTSHGTEKIISGKVLTNE